MPNRHEQIIANVSIAEANEIADIAGREVGEAMKTSGFRTDLHGVQINNALHVLRSQYLLLNEPIRDSIQSHEKRKRALNNWRAMRKIQLGIYPDGTTGKFRAFMKSAAGKRAIERSRDTSERIPDAPWGPDGNG